MLDVLKPLWAYRGFVLGSVRREFQSRYRNSLLGAAWTVIQPLAMITVYTVIFAQVMRARLPGMDSGLAYSIYLCAGITTWGLFAEITGRAQNIFIEHANLLKKLSFPHLCLPAVVMLNAVLNFAIVFALFSAFLLISGSFPGWPYLALIPLLVIQCAFAIGLGITLGVLNVFFRDVGQLFGVMLQFWFWLTPVVYPLDILPGFARSIVDCNPMTALVVGYQAILVSGQWPPWQDLWLVSLLAVMLCATAVRLFRKHVGEMVDEL